MDVRTGIGRFVVGLKNIWQFPPSPGAVRGSAFLLAYVFFLLAAWCADAHDPDHARAPRRASPVTGFDSITRRVHGARFCDGRVPPVCWPLSGVFLLCRGGWLDTCLCHARRQRHPDGLTAEGAASVFMALVKDPEKQLFWHSLFVLLTMLTVAGGVRAGLERVTRYAVPLIFLLLLLLVATRRAVDRSGSVRNIFCARIFPSSARMACWWPW